MRKIIFWGLLWMTLAISISCQGNSPTKPDIGGQEKRSYALGFTDFPYAKSVLAVAEAFRVITNDGDMAVMHFDSGIPWQEALDGTPYPQNFMAQLNGEAGAIPSGHVTYLAITPIGFSRDGLAAKQGNTPNEPLDSPWDTRTFDHPDVIRAFINHSENMIRIFSPDYFAFAIEANMLIDLAPSKWPAFVTLARSVYDSLKTRHPNLPIFISLQAEWFYKDPNGQRSALAQILPYTDMIAVSSYPFTEQADPALLPTDYFSTIAGLDSGKPFAIAETSWPAENVTSPYPKFIPASDSTQLAYMKRLLAENDKLSSKFINWFFTRDFDDFWESDFKFSPLAPLVRLWKDTGLYDGNGNARPALTPWRDKLKLPRETL